MYHLIRPFALALALTTSAAFAQSTDEASPAPAETDAETTTDGETASVPGLSLGQPENQPGQAYVKEEFADWELRCVPLREGVEVCQLYQLMTDGDGNAVAEFNIFPLPEGQQAAAGANIVTPLETLLTANLRLAVDGGQGKVYPYSFCSQVGCFSRIGLTSEELGAFRRGAVANVTIVPASAPNETVNLTLSLSGFTAGYAALLEAEAARIAAQAAESEGAASE
ncbi:MAG: invasion associated locus B family protein [Paracoccaceae bacterium]